MDIPEILDITAVEDGLKGEVLLEKFGSLPLGGHLILNYDRDPKALYFLLLERAGRNFSWKLLETGPEVWQVKLGKRSDFDRRESIGAMVTNDPRKASVFKELAENMEKEEELLFPYLIDLAYALKSGTRLSAPAQGSLNPVVYAMEAAHERIYNAFFRIRQLTGHYCAPDYVTHGFRILYKILQEFEDDLQMHLHLENNILFPAALRNENELRLRQLQVEPTIKS